MDCKQKLALSICDFLQDSISDNTIENDSKEGIQAAIKEIQTAFKLDNSKAEKLMPVFKVYLDTKKQAAGNASTSTVSNADKVAADELKSEGNKALASKNYQLAIEKYTAAIQLNSSAVYFANRAAAYSQNGQHEKARDDSKKALEIDSDYSKAYSRLGHAEFCLGNYRDSVAAYKKGLQMEPNNNSIKQSLAAAETKLAEMTSSTTASRSAPAASGFPGMGGGMPDFSAMMQDPNFMSMAQNMMSNPAIAGMLNNPALQNMMSGMQGAPDLASMMANPQLQQMAQGLMSNPEAMNSLLSDPTVAEMASKYGKK